MILLLGFVCVYDGVLFGIWSDDGVQVFVLFDVLLCEYDLNFDMFVGNLLDWFYCGVFMLDGCVFDVGLQMQCVFYVLVVGVVFVVVGFGDECDNGNGLLMCCFFVVMVVVLCDDVIWFVCKQSVVMYGYVCLQFCCVFYCLMVLGIVDGQLVFDVVCMVEDELFVCYEGMVDEIELKIVFDGCFDVL